MMPNIELHIEELVLHGFSRSDRHRMAQALESELKRLLAEQGVPPSLLRGGQIAQLDAGAFQAGKGSRPEEVGVEIARSVYRGLTR